MTGRRSISRCGSNQRVRRSRSHTSCAAQVIRAVSISFRPRAVVLPAPVEPHQSLTARAVPILVGVRSGLLGGTFDPPHIAHLLAGEVAYRQLGLDRVIYLPAGSPWQKADRKVSPADHRWRMTEIATSGVSYFVPDDREVHRDGMDLHGRHLGDLRSF